MPFTILKFAAMKMSTFTRNESKSIGDSANQGLETEEKIKATTLFNIAETEPKEVMIKEKFMNCKIQSLQRLIMLRI